jgi:hypothetical protein
MKMYGEDVEINISFQNSNETISLNSTSYRLRITGLQGDVFVVDVLASSVEKISIPAFSTLHIGIYEWNQTDLNMSQVLPGEYTITVELLSDPYQAQTTIIILAPESPYCTLQVTTEKQNYTIGDAIAINAKFINNGSEPITLYSTSYELSIMGPSGGVLSIAEERMSLGPTNVSAYSEIQICSHVWDQKYIDSGLQVPPGNYTIYVTLTYDKYQGKTTITIQ